MQGFCPFPRIPTTPLCNPFATLLQPNVTSGDGAGRYSLVLRGTTAYVHTVY